MTEDDNAPKPDRGAGDADVLALAEGLVASLGKTFNRADLTVLQTVVQSYPDVGQDGAGDVAASLDGLIAGFLADETYDREAIAVHVRAWRFLAGGKRDRSERDRVLAGLGEVRGLYGAPKAA